MGHANFCPVCGEITGGWDEEEIADCQCVTGVDSNGGVTDWEKYADYLVEMLDFATDAMVEARNYSRRALAHYESVRNPYSALSKFDRARITLAASRAEQEFENLANLNEATDEGEEEQVRCACHDC